MNVQNLGYKQKGAFAIEFAIVATVFALILVFSGDIVMKLSVKGKLDRLSYSLVNIAKERTQLYDEITQLTKAEAQQIDTIARRSLARTLGAFDMSRYGILIEEQGFYDVGTSNAMPLNRYQFGVLHCDVRQSLSALKEMSVVSSWGRQVPLYRVTLCYQSANWMGEWIGKDYRTVASDAIQIGR